MTYLIVFHWGWMAASLVLGLITGWIAFAHEGGNRSGRWLKWAIALLALAIVLSLAHVVPGRAGYWLDLGLLMTIAFIVGAYAGGRLRAMIAPLPALPPASPGDDAESPAQTG